VTLFQSCRISSLFRHYFYTSAHQAYSWTEPCLRGISGKTLTKAVQPQHKLVCDVLITQSSPGFTQSYPDFTQSCPDFTQSCLSPLTPPDTTPKHKLTKLYIPHWRWSVHCAAPGFTILTLQASKRGFVHHIDTFLTTFGNLEILCHLRDVNRISCDFLGNRISAYEQLRRMDKYQILVHWKE
jgi:hypothetical protein